MKKIKAYLKIGDDPSNLKSIKGRRRLSTVIEDKPLELFKKYPIDLSLGKLNLLVIPDAGTKPGETELNFEYRV